MPLTKKQEAQIRRINPDTAPRVTLPKFLRSLLPEEHKELRRELYDFPYRYHPLWPKTLYRKCYKHACRTRRPAITVGLGPAVSGGTIAKVSGAHGIYFSSTGDIGMYGSMSVGVGVVAGFAITTQFTVVLGPPSKFLGDCLAISFNLGELVSFGGALLMDIAPPHRIFGAMIEVGVGFGLIPLEVTIDCQRSWDQEWGRRMLP